MLTCSNTGMDAKESLLALRSHPVGWREWEVDTSCGLPIAEEDPTNREPKGVLAYHLSEKRNKK